MKKILLITILVLIPVLIYLYGPVTGSQVPFKEPMLTFRFDDAWSNQAGVVKILTREKITATFYPIGGFIGSPGYMNSEDLKGLLHLGHEIGYHSDSHMNFLFTTGSRHRAETTPPGSPDFLSKNIKTFAYPYGLYNPLFLSEIEKEYQGACIYPVIRRGTLNHRGSNPWFLDCIEIDNYPQFQKLLKKAIGGRLWLIACFHRIEAIDGPWSCSLEEFERIAAHAASEARKGKVRVVTVAEGVKEVAR